MADYLEIAKQALERYRVQRESSSDRAPFPRCPRCGSFALYRRNGQGNDQCETCDMSVDAARRVE